MKDENIIRASFVDECFEESKMKVNIHDNKGVYLTMNHFGKEVVISLCEEDSKHLRDFLNEHVHD